MLSCHENSFRRLHIVWKTLPANSSHELFCTPAQELDYAEKCLPCDAASLNLSAHGSAVLVKTPPLIRKACNISSVSEPGRNKHLANSLCFFARVSCANLKYCEFFKLLIRGVVA